MSTYLIAHSKAEGETGVADGYKASLEGGNPDDTFVLGRDNFFRCQEVYNKKDLWKLWPEERATDQRSEFGRFDRCVVPLTENVIGQATYRIIMGFLMADKMVVAWNPETNEMKEVGAVSELAEEGQRPDFINYGECIFVEES